MEAFYTVASMNESEPLDIVEVVYEDNTECFWAQVIFVGRTAY